MSDDPKMTDQQRVAEEHLKAMQAANGGELVRDEAGRLRLTHPAKPPAPSR